MNEALGYPILSLSNLDKSKLRKQKSQGQSELYFSIPFLADIY
jgi:hypothetical protein